MKHLTFIILLFFFATSCKKKSTVTIQAQDYITGEGIDYAGMEYRVVEKWIPLLEPKTKVAASGFLDENGHVNFDLKMNPNRSYILTVGQPDNICYGGLQLYYLDHEKSNTITFDYAHCGYMDIKSNNVNCEGPDDEFRYKYYVTSNPNIYIYIGFLYEGNWDPEDFIAGCQDYSGVNIYSQRPVGDYTVEWQVIRPSGTTTGIDYFTISENDTTTYVIEY